MTADTPALWSWRGVTGRYLTLTFPRNAPVVIVNEQGTKNAAGIVTASYTPEEFEEWYGKLILPIEHAHRQQQIDELREALRPAR